MELLEGNLGEHSDVFFSETLEVVSNSTKEKFGELTVNVSRENGIVLVRAICDGIVDDTRCGTKVETKLNDSLETLAHIQAEFFHIDDEANDTRSVQSSIEIAERTANEPIKVIIKDWKTPDDEESLIELDDYKTFLSSGACFVLFRLLAQNCTETSALSLMTINSKGKLASLTLIASIERAILRSNAGVDTEQLIVAIEKKVEDSDKKSDFWRIYLRRTGELLLWEHVGDPVVMRAAEQIIDLRSDNDEQTFADDDKLNANASGQIAEDLSESSFGLSRIFGWQTDDVGDEYLMSETDPYAQIESDTETSFIDLSHAESEEMANYSSQNVVPLPTEEGDLFLETSDAQNTDPIALKSAIVGAVPNQPIQERNSQMSFRFDEEYYRQNDATIDENAANLSQVLDDTVTQWVNEAMDEAVVLEEKSLNENAQQQKENESARRESASSSQSTVIDSIDYNLEWLFGHDDDPLPIGDDVQSKRVKKRPQVSWMHTTIPRRKENKDPGNDDEMMSPAHSIRSRPDSLASENMPELMRIFGTRSSPSIIATSPYVRPPSPNPIEVPTDDEGFHSQISSQTTPVAEDPKKYEPGMYANLWAKLKQNTSLSCYKYIEQHPEIPDMLTDYLQCLLMTEPKDIREFSAMYFTILNSMK
uniref:Ciliogenesis-associated TTC17-interacting protein N-terminal domain-containing protein n=1 Tax=Plectus sambesii TaxID=2011161 RepID=A0A914UQY4_9BILA